MATIDDAPALVELDGDALEGVAIRSAEGLQFERTPGGGRIGGYAAIYDSFSLAKPGSKNAREVIRRGAFTESLRSGREVFAYVNHDRSKLLGRTGAGTLRLRDDEKGLAYEIDLPDTGYARDLAKLVERGDVPGASFAMRLGRGDAVWTSDKSGPVREIRRAALSEVSPVTESPAYPGTTAELRALAQWLDGGALPEDARRMSEADRLALRLAAHRLGVDRQRLALGPTIR